jgi:hypothetical protein
MKLNSDLLQNDTKENNFNAMSLGSGEKIYAFLHVHKVHIPMQ